MKIAKNKALIKVQSHPSVFTFFPFEFKEDVIILRLSHQCINTKNSHLCKQQLLETGGPRYSWLC